MIKGIGKDHAFAVHETGGGADIIRIQLHALLPVGEMIRHDAVDPVLGSGHGLEHIRRAGVLLKFAAGMRGEKLIREDLFQDLAQAEILAYPRGADVRAAKPIADLHGLRSGEKIIEFRGGDHKNGREDIHLQIVAVHAAAPCQADRDCGAQRDRGQHTKNRRAEIDPFILQHPAAELIVEAVEKAAQTRGLRQTLPAGEHQENFDDAEARDHRDVGGEHAAVAEQALRLALGEAETGGNLQHRAVELLQLTAQAVDQRKRRQPVDQSKDREEGLAAAQMFFRVDHTLDKRQERRDHKTDQYFTDKVFSHRTTPPAGSPAWSHSLPETGPGCRNG